MRPYIILHNSISLDGSLSNFNVNMELHYQLSGRYNPDAHLIGSNTIKTGIKMFGNSSKEISEDFKKPTRDNKLPNWIIIDSKGKLMNHLHEIRRFEFCKDIIILISKKTPKDYIQYLEDRNYNFHIIGKKKVDLDKSLNFLSNKYKIKTILTDTGQILGNLLINKNLINEISLLIHPIIVGKKSYNIFGDIKKIKQLKLIKYNKFNDGYIWVVFSIK